MKITISSNIRDYDVIFTDNFNFIYELKDIKNSIWIIDKNIYNLYNNLFLDIHKENLFIFNAIEENKTLDYVQEIYDFLISKSVKRNLTIISIGGGITQDITGFVASTLYRGVNWIFIPTTFLSMTDSCIGSKTSVNYKNYKNLMGTFYPPQKIYINPSFLDTLNKLDFFSGVGETIKFQLMKEDYPKDFEKILTTINKTINDKESRLDIIHDNINIKLSYIKDDEFDLGRRNLLNYGHCFGHALETSSDYYVPHGIAVTIGMIFANIISANRKLNNTKEVNFVNHEILYPNIPLRLREMDFNENILLESMKNDKKRIGEYLTVIIPNKEFKMIKIDNVSDNEFKNTLNMLKEILFEGTKK